MQQKSDAQLLREYADHGAETAFAEIVVRHTNLVYSAALRQVDSPDMAAEVAQSAFIGLARGARLLSPKLDENASLAGWLCRSARNISLNLRRDEFRRHSRERQAMENLNSMPDTAPDWERLRSVLDEAMAGLSEPDYDAVVLRFFENLDLRSVGLALGLSDDTAQKRVSRALDKLRELLSQRGIATPAVALSTILSANAVQVAPAGLAATISNAAVLGGTTLAAPATATATKAAAMSILQKTLIAAALTAAVGAGIYQAHQASTSRAQAQMLQEQQAPLAEQIEQLRKERDVAQSELTTARQEIAQLRRNTADLFRLRGEVARLRGEMAVRISAATNTPIFEVSADPTNAPSTQVNVRSRFIVGPADLLVRLGLPMEGATGVLTDVQFRGLQKTLEKSQEVTIGRSPEVTTVSGREAQVMSVNPVTTGGSVRETVSTLGVIPAVRADGITIDLSVSVRLWETKPPSKEAEISINPPLSDTNPWTSAVVWDGQTVAISKKLNAAAAPHSPATTSDQLLVVFVSPTLIDPAGNRLHTEEELEDLLGRDRKR